ncbi:MAG TPA: sulfite exporter TauE/SafE family protein [Bacillus bacterium]|nr:sulfite exporter TauE/SafE family protein [Bacillus sp. (in: firmicutes)]
MEWVVLFIVGLSSGVIGSLVGLGGGIITVPALLFISAYTVLIGKISPQIAVGTSSLVIIATGLSSTLTYIKLKKIDYVSGLLFFIGSAPGAIIGAMTNKYLNAEQFNLYFGIFIIFISLTLMFRGRLKAKTSSTSRFRINRTSVDERGNTNQYSFNIFFAIFISFIVGFLGGIFGIGGGSLMVPAMLLLFRFPPHIAVATSMFLIFLSSTVSSYTHFNLGNIDWIIAIALIPGAWIGAKIGSIINQRMKADTVVKILRFILIIIGIRLIVQI